MSEQKFPWLISIYKEENRILIVPEINHIGGFSVCSEKFKVVNECTDYKLIGKNIMSAKAIIATSPLSSLKPAERIGPWEMNSKYKTHSSFWKNNNCAFFNFYENGEMKVYSAEKIRGGGYGGCIKEICLPKDATPEEIGKSVIDVLAAAEEYYQDKATEYIYPTKVVELMDNSKLTIKHPKDKHFVDSEDCHASEIYQCYSYLQSEDAEATAEFLVGIAPEIDCNMDSTNVRKCWEKFYGEAEAFEMNEVDYGIFKYRVELKNKSIHKISYFLQMQEDLILECSMNLYKPNKRKKLDEKLVELFGKFVLGCKFEEN